MNTPVEQKDLPESIQKLLAKAREVLRPSAIVLYGSRAREDCSPTSDFDLAFQGVANKLGWTGFYNYVQHESPTIYQVDLVLYEQAPEELKLSIDSEGRVINESSA